MKKSDEVTKALQKLRIYNLEVFNRRLIAMMKEYNITLRKALYWDMRGFVITKPLVGTMVERYLTLNGIFVIPDRQYYQKIMNGESSDVKLSELTDSKDNDPSRDK